MIRKHTLLGAAGAGALVLSLVGPATAAGEESADVTYTCPTSLGLTPAPVAHYVVDAPPATMVAGQKVALATTGTITLDATTTGALYTSFGWRKFDAKIVTPPTASTVGQNLTVAKSPVPSTGEAVGSLSGKTIVRPVKAGTYTLRLGNLGSPKGLPAGAVTLNGYDASDAVLNTAVFPDGGAFGQCTNVATTTPLQNASAVNATVKVSKDASTTTVGAAYSKAKRATIASAMVKGKTFKLTGTGTVTFKLKKGTSTLMTIKGVKLNSKGIAKTVFKKALRHGKYKVVATYGGSAGLKPSTGAHTFSVR